MRTRALWVSLVTAVTVACLVAGLSLSGCAKGARDSAAAPTAEMAGAEAPQAKRMAMDEAVSGGGALGDGEAYTPPADRKIITTGSMDLEVQDLDAAVASLTALVRQHGGFFASKNISRMDDWRTASLTIRVPAAKFEAVHEGAVGLGVVQRDEQSGDDVTKQWQDLEARIRIRKTKEASLLKLMQKQAKLTDLLTVERDLWEVREQIEVAEGELRYLRDKVSLATLEISLREQIPVSVGPLGAWNLGYHLTNAIRSLGAALRGLLIGIIYVVITGAVVWVPLLLIVLLILRRVKRRLAARFPKAPPPARPES